VGAQLRAASERLSPRASQPESFGPSGPG